MDEQKGRAVMNEKDQIAEKAEALRDSVGKALKNRLCFPKTILGLMKEGKVNVDQVAKMLDTLDESIKVVDAKFIDFIEELKNL